MADVLETDGWDAGMGWRWMDGQIRSAAGGVMDGRHSGVGGRRSVRKIKSWRAKMHNLYPYFT